MKSKLVLLALLLAGTSEAAMPSIVISATGGASMAKNAQRNRKIYAEIQKTFEAELATAEKELQTLKAESERAEKEYNEVQNETEQSRTTSQMSQEQHLKFEKAKSEHNNAQREHNNAKENIRNFPNTIDAIKRHQAAKHERNSASAVIDANIAVTFAKDKFFFGITGGYMHNFGSQTAQRSLTEIDYTNLANENIQFDKEKLDQKILRLNNAQPANTNEGEYFELISKVALATNSSTSETVRCFFAVNQEYEISNRRIKEKMNGLKNYISETKENLKTLETLRNDVELRTLFETVDEKKAQIQAHVWNYENQNEGYKKNSEHEKAKEALDDAIKKKLNIENWLAREIINSKNYAAQLPAQEEELASYEKIASVATKSVSAQHSHMFYAGAVFGYNFTEKVSAGLSLNYVASSVSAKISYLDTNDKEVEGLTKEFESEIFHGVMPTIFASYAIGKGISAKVSVGYAIFFDKDAQAGKASELVELGNVFIATAGVSFKAM